MQPKAQVIHSHETKIHPITKKCQSYVILVNHFGIDNHGFVLKGDDKVFDKNDFKDDEAATESAIKGFIQFADKFDEGLFDYRIDVTATVIETEAGGAFLRFDEILTVARYLKAQRDSGDITYEKS